MMELETRRSTASVDELGDLAEVADDTPDDDAEDEAADEADEYNE
jgi:hypothetical protein